MENRDTQHAQDESGADLQEGERARTDRGRGDRERAEHERAEHERHDGDQGDTGRPDPQGDGERSDDDAEDHGVRFVDWKVAVVGGGVGAVVAFGTMFALGKIGAFQAQQLLQNTLPTIRFLCSSIVTATATVLALMLTLLSVSYTTTSTLKAVHYERIRQISWLCAVTIIASVLLLIFLALPLGEAEEFPTAWFDYVYYGVLTCSALLGGLFFSIVIMLLNAVQGLIGVVHPHVESGLVVRED